jgi:RimJ/RimL family protein N-acetyltransferase
MMGAPSLDDLMGGRSRLPVPHEGHSVVLRCAASAAAPLLAEWREANRRWFLTEFPADEAKTLTWLATSARTASRLLLIVEVDGSPVGHLGLRDIDVAGREAEVDNVVRGRPGGGKGLMSTALQSMLAWAGNVLGIERFVLRVFADNPARDFYTRVGFTLVGPPVALRFDGRPGDGAWRPTGGTGERTLVQMELDMPVLPAASGANGADR